MMCSESITERYVVRVLILAIWAFVAGCAGGTDVGNPDMRSFSSDTDLNDYLVSQYAQSAMSVSRQPAAEDMPYEWIYSGADQEPSGPVDRGFPDMDADAPDRVVSGNGFLIVAGESEVRIVAAESPETMYIAGRITVEGHVDALHLDGYRLVVLYTPDGVGAPSGMNHAQTVLQEGFPVQPRSGILVADIGLPHNPQINHHMHADGYRMASRITGGILHVAVGFMPDLPPLQLWHDGTQSGVTEAEDYNAYALEGLGIDDLTPFYTAFDSFGHPVARGRLTATEDYIRPVEAGGGGILTILSIDLDTPGTHFSSMGIIADIHHVYASSSAFHLLSTVFDEDTPDIFQTRIYRIDITGDTALYAAQGGVRGRLLHPTAIGQYQDVLKIITVTGLFRDDSATGHIFCMQEKKGQLPIIGRLENLFSGSTPWLARFYGVKGFIASAEDIDRLTIIDLADPAFPQKGGEMRLPGFVSGLSPIYEDLLLAVTEYACANESFSTTEPGLCLSLYDIRDSLSPQLLHMEAINGARGENGLGGGNDGAMAYRMAAAPRFWPEDRLLAVPVTIDDDRQSPGTAGMAGLELFSGLYLYGLFDAGVLERIGRLALWPDKALDMAVDADIPPPWVRGELIDDAIYVIGPDRVSAGGMHRIGDGLIIHPQFTLVLE